jgi:voltage-gated potassium channel
MTADPYQDLSAAARRRTVLRALLRGFLNTTVLIVLYYVLPLGQPLGTGAAVSVLIGLAVFAAITAWQIKTIIGSPYPGMKAVEALGLLLPFTCWCSPRRVS